MILITGASRGIGNFLAEKYYGLSKNIVGTYNNSNEGFGFAEKILFKVNVADYDSVNNWINSLWKNFHGMGFAFSNFWTFGNIIYCVPCKRFSWSLFRFN